MAPCTAGALTLEGERTTLASNVAQGRHLAGGHWRPDATHSQRLRERPAIHLLETCAPGHAEFAPGEVVFRFKRFDGTTQTFSA